MMNYMRMSRLYAPTLKEDPTEAELASHRLLLRAGMIRKEAAGLYAYLPLAWRSIRKIENICREEQEAINSQEMMVPILTDAELWHQSGRWDAYGPELMRFSDRHNREFALGPTHEETFTDLVRSELRSYKQLPVTLYQIQDKFRDELRPRFGLMRGREFIMKDGYSFSATQESLQECYDMQKDAYARFCLRCGLRALPVAADSGQIGGDTSVEYMALADAGEAALVYCDECGFAADTEAATAHCEVIDDVAGELTRIETPHVTSIADLAAFLDVPEAQTRKAIALIDGEGQPWIVMVPGDHEINDVKTGHAFGEYHLMTDEELELAGLQKGFMGPVNVPDGVFVAADIALKNSKSWLVGANEAGYHLRSAQLGHDFEINQWVDVITAKAGDICPHCGQALSGARGIECGQVFQLGTKYSEAMGATFTDADGKEKPLIMGCYGIGISRTLAAVVEQHHDDAGIIWPVSVAPYEVEVISLDNKGEVFEAAEQVATKLTEAGLDVLLDDRKERPGVKFAEADLMGFPWQVVIGKRGLKTGMAELKCRATGKREDIALDELTDRLSGQIVPARMGLLAK
ncbi:proline--tRNA ligase [Coriobacteriaceae bacterium BV3Ac1]|uniref:proline--tRNA ligase n=1 Tax=Olegusella massiliensis TaxID=1776381 RepID=UPI0003ADAFD7|nr:proline--tRNA ligase [Olegusella massiliensis]ERL12290.1 proline--tRNA ligase [Coriobacteriaceae bacterium BV3Ac1]